MTLNLLRSSGRTPLISTCRPHILGSPRR
jgi:hypothetical protein